MIYSMKNIVVICCIVFLGCGQGRKQDYTSKVNVKLKSQKKTETKVDTISVSDYPYSFCIDGQKTYFFNENVSSTPGHAQSIKCKDFGNASIKYLFKKENLIVAGVGSFGRVDTNFVMLVNQTCKLLKEIPELYIKKIISSNAFLCLDNKLVGGFQTFVYDFLKKDTLFKFKQEKHVIIDNSYFYTHDDINNDNIHVTKYDLKFKKTGNFKIQKNQYRQLVAFFAKDYFSIDTNKHLLVQSDYQGNIKKQWDLPNLNLYQVLIEDGNFYIYGWANRVFNNGGKYYLIKQKITGIVPKSLKLTVRSY